MKSSNPNEILEDFEEQESIPNKSKKKKPTPKKSKHKHIYDKFLIVEEAPAYLASFKNKLTYTTYKKCSICGKTDWCNLPTYMMDELEKTLYGNSKENISYWYNSVRNREEAKYLEQKYPEIIEVSYLEK